MAGEHLDTQAESQPQMTNEAQHVEAPALSAPQRYDERPSKQAVAATQDPQAEQELIAARQKERLALEAINQRGSDRPGPQLQPVPSSRRSRAPTGGDTGEPHFFHPADILRYFRKDDGGSQWRAFMELGDAKRRSILASMHDNYVLNPNQELQRLAFDGVSMLFGDWLDWHNDHLQSQLYRIETPDNFWQEAILDSPDGHSSTIRQLLVPKEPLIRRWPRFANAQHLSDFRALPKTVRYEKLENLHFECSQQAEPSELDLQNFAHRFRAYVDAHNRASDMDLDGHEQLFYINLTDDDNELLNQALPTFLTIQQLMQASPDEEEIGDDDHADSDEIPIESLDSLVEIARAKRRKQRANDGDDGEWVDPGDEDEDDEDEDDEDDDQPLPPRKRAKIVPPPASAPATVASAPPKPKHKKGSRKATPRLPGEKKKRTRDRTMSTLRKKGWVEIPRPSKDEGQIPIKDLDKLIRGPKRERGNTLHQAAPYYFRPKGYIYPDVRPVLKTKNPDGSYLFSEKDCAGLWDKSKLEWAQLGDEEALIGKTVTGAVRQRAQPTYSRQHDPITGRFSDAPDSEKRKLSEMGKVRAAAWAMDDPNIDDYPAFQRKRVDRKQWGKLMKETHNVKAEHFRKLEANRKLELEMQDERASFESKTNELLDVSRQRTNDLKDMCKRARNLRKALVKVWPDRDAEWFDAIETGAVEVTEEDLGVEADGA